MNKMIIGILAAAILSSCQMNTPALQQQKEREPVRVRLLTVSATNTVSRNSHIGQVAASREVVLTAPFNGVLKSLDARKGSVVDGGEVVAVLYSQQVESAWNIAKADYCQATDAMDRMSKVYGNGSVTELQLIDMQTKLDKAHATMEAARKAKDDCSLKAPYRAVVSEVYPSEGENLVIGARVVKITDINNLRIEIPVHENEIGTITEGMKAQVDIPALGVEDLAARVTEKGVLPSSLSHSYLCALKIEGNCPGMMPGMAVKARFESRDEDRRIVIPASAIQLDSRGQYVWISESGTVAKRHVVTGGYSGKGVIISEGLKDGDKVIFEGYQKVSTGMIITEVQ